MKTITLTPSASDCRPTEATIGFFDGVHLGHRHLIRRAVEEAHAHDLRAAAVTFDRHPRCVLHADYRPPLLTTLDERLQLLAATGVDAAVVLPFTSEMASLTAREFLADILVKRLGCRRLLMGYDHRFGSDGLRSPADYDRLGAELGVGVSHCGPLQVCGVNVSSSVVRAFVSEGEMAMAASCLGRPYSITGTVAHGDHVGTGLGFPTANIAPESVATMIPARGVYAAEAYLGAAVATGGAAEPSGRYRAVVNIGTRPTFGTHPVTIEAHLLGFSGNLYGHSLTLRFTRRLRAERTFASREALEAQLRRDIEEAGEGKEN